jgi:hypothetical protein
VPQTGAPEGASVFVPFGSVPDTSGVFSITRESQRRVPVAAS